MPLTITAEVALYPLREPELAPVILEFVEALRARGLQVRTGPMSSLVTGEAGAVFDALRDVFAEMAAQRQVVLRATFGTAAPVSG